MLEVQLLRLYERVQLGEWTTQIANGRETLKWLGTTPSANTLGTPALERAEIEHIISGWPKWAALAHLGMLSTLQTNEEEDPKKVFEFLHRYLLTRKQQRQLRVLETTSRIASIVSVATIRKLMLLVMAFADETPSKSIKTARLLHESGQVMLSLSNFDDESADPKPDDETLRIWFAQRLFRNGYIGGSPWKRLLRVYDDLFRPSAIERFGCDLRNHVPYDVTCLCAAHMLLHTVAGQYTLCAYETTGEPLPIHADRLFGQAGLGIEALVALGDLSLSADDLPKPQDVWSNLNDLTPLFRSPYVQMAPYKLAILDRDFAMIRLARSAYDAVLHYEKARGRDFAAKSFEWMLHEELIKAQKAQRYDNPKIYINTNASMEIDGVYQQGFLTLLFEAKSAPLDPRWVFERPSLEFAAHLRKTIIGPKNKRGDDTPAIQQIQERIKRLVANPDKVGLDPPRVILPVLLVLDDLLSNPLIAEYLSLAGTEFLNHDDCLVKPLLVLHMADLRRLVNFAQNISLCDALWKLQAHMAGDIVRTDHIIHDNFDNCNYLSKDVTRVHDTEGFSSAFDRINLLFRNPMASLCAKCNSGMARFSTRSGEIQFLCPACGGSPQPALPSQFEQQQLEDVLFSSRFFSSLYGNGWIQ